MPNGIITKYKISWKSDDPEGVKEKYYIPSMDEEQMFMEVRRLKESKRYSFWITAATSLGMGTSSKIESVVVTSKGIYFNVTKKQYTTMYILKPKGFYLKENRVVKGVKACVNFSSLWELSPVEFYFFCALQLQPKLHHFPSREDLNWTKPYCCLVEPWVGHFRKLLG